MLFCCKKITFLGHVVNNEGTKLNLSKIDAVLHFLEPRMITNIRYFLGLTGYYWDFVQGYSQLVIMLFELTKKDVNFVWDLGCQQAFEVLKETLVNVLVFIWPNFQKQLCLDVDWSPKGVGAILSQREGKHEKVVAYVSKSLMAT
jgi:hypothetical protein